MNHVMQCRALTDTKYMIGRTEASLPLVSVFREWSVLYPNVSDEINQSADSSQLFKETIIIS